MSHPNTISISIQTADGSRPKSITNIPWFPGVTVLQAMIIGQAMNPGAFSFRVLYHSFYGAFVDMVDDVTDQPPQFWMFSVSNNASLVGVSEALVLENAAGQNVDIEWTFTIPNNHAASASQGNSKREMYNSTKS